MHTPGGEVYSYLNIWTAKNSTETLEKIENVVVCFKVSKTWISENKIEADSITLDHYDSEKWESFSTVKEDDEHVYLEAKTTGFSNFAIVGGKSDEANRNPELAPVTRISEKLKKTAEDFEAAAFRSLDVKGPVVLAEVESYEKNFRNFTGLWLKDKS